MKEFLFPFIAAYDINKQILQNHKFFKLSQLNSKWKNALKIKRGTYDAILEKIEKNITGTDYDIINKQWCKELKKEGIPKEDINQLQDEINKITYDGIAQKWSSLINKFTKNKSQLEKIANDLYVSHERGVSNVERKAASLLIAVGFSISLIFFINFEEGLIQPLLDKISKDPNFRNKDGTTKYREGLRQAREKWIQIMNKDVELKKWYDTFLKNSVIAKKQEYGIVSTYRKEVYSHWDFPA